MCAQLDPVHGHEIQIPCALDGLHEHVDAMIQVHFQSRLILQSQVHDGIVVIRPVGDSSQRVHAMQLMENVQRRGICVIPQPPVFIFQLGHDGRILAYFDNVLTSNGDHASDTPFLPDCVYLWTRSLPGDRCIVLSGVKRAVGHFRLIFKVNSVIQGGCKSVSADLQKTPSYGPTYSRLSFAVSRG